MLTHALLSSDEVGVLREALGVAGVVAHLNKAVRALEALVVLGPEAGLAGSVAANADVARGVRVERDRLAIAHTHVPLVRCLRKVHA
jgi:hypothetical protein